MTSQDRAFDPAAVLGLLGSGGAWLLNHAEIISLGLSWAAGLLGIAVAGVSLLVKIRHLRHGAHPPPSPRQAPLRRPAPADGGHDPHTRTD